MERLLDTMAAVVFFLFVGALLVTAGMLFGRSGAQFFFGELTNPDQTALAAAVLGKEAKIKLIPLTQEPFK